MTILTGGKFNALESTSSCARIPGGADHGSRCHERRRRHAPAAEAEEIDGSRRHRISRQPAERARGQEELRAGGRRRFRRRHRRIARRHHRRIAGAPAGHQRHARSRQHEPGSVRGLGPRLVLGLVNGREVASSEPNRNVRWEIYPSEVVSGADVYKSQSADLVAGGVAGTIDIRTIRPLDYPGPKSCCAAGRCTTRPVRTFRAMTRTVTAAAPASRTLERQFRLQHRRQRAAPEERLPVVPGLGLQRRQPSTPSNATGDIDDDGTIDPTPWGAQTEVKKLTEDRLRRERRHRLASDGQFRAQLRRAVFEVHHRRRPEPGLVRPQRLMGNWDNGHAVVLRRPAVQRTPQMTAPSSRATLDNCYALGHQRHREVHRRQGPVRHRRQHQDSNRTWTVTGDLSYSKATRNNRWAAFRVGGIAGDDDLRHGSGSHAVAHHQLESCRSQHPGGAELAARSGPMAPTISRTNSPRCAWTSTRSYEGDQLKSYQVRRAHSPSAKRTICAASRTTSRIIPGTLPARLFTNYSGERVRRAAAAQRRLRRNRRLRVRRHAGERQAPSSRAAWLGRGRRR